jgi:hypothetical protein
MKMNMKNKLLLILGGLLLAAAAAVQAQDAYSTNADGSIYTYSTNADGSANIVAYAGPPWAVTIPTNINSLTVTTIGYEAFVHSSLTSITIPGSVTSIGEYAFNYCTSLTNATIDNGVTNIGEGAFYICTSLTSVTIPRSVTNIGETAFYLCTSLTSVTIPNSVASIEGYAFAYCTSLTSVTIPNSFTRFEGVFADCPNLKNVTFDNGVTNIGGLEFSSCYSLTNVIIPASVASIGGGAFDDCTSLAAITVATNNPAYSSANGVLFDKSQTMLIQYPGGLIGGSYTIPNSVTSIGVQAFAYCTSLASVSIPNSVTSIGEGAFDYCPSLTSVTIPNSVTNIGEVVFEDCTGLTNVTINNSVISSDEFIGCSSLTSVTIPNSVTNIGSYAFYYCPSLTSVYFQGNSPTPTNDSTVFYEDSATVYYLPGTTGWGAMFDSRPTAPWLPNPRILNNGDILIQFSGGVPGALYDVEESSNLLTWTVAATDPANAMGSFSFEDTATAGVPMRYYRAACAFTVGGTLTGLPAGDTVTLQDNGSDNLTLSTNGTFTFATALPNGHAYSVTVSGTRGTPATLTNGSGTISGANVTNVAVQCSAAGCPALTGIMDEDMYNAAVADGTANGGVPAVMFTTVGGPFTVTAAGTCSENVAITYDYWAWFDTTVGSYSCSSTTFPSGTRVIAFGSEVDCGAPSYTY